VTDYQYRPTGIQAFINIIMAHKSEALIIRPICNYVFTVTAPLWACRNIYPILTKLGTDVWNLKRKNPFVKVKIQIKCVPGLFMAARQLAGRDGHYILLLMFLSSYFLFFRRLISEVSGLFVTKLCHMFGSDCNFFKLSQKFGGSSPRKFGGPKTSKFRILQFDREYLRMGTRYRRSENGVENCNHSPTCVPNLVNFGPQTAKK